jgi:iron(III) transport system permease protein
MTLPAVLIMAAVGGLAVGVPAASMMLTSVMGTLSGGVSVENVTLRHFAALFDQQGMPCRPSAPACRWPWARR